MALARARLRKPEGVHLDGGASASLLSTLAQIAGVFLGLYFAAVGTLISARYSNVPPNVRELMFADKLGNQYIKLVALFGAVATLLLAGAEYWNADRAPQYRPGHGPRRGDDFEFRVARMWPPKFFDPASSVSHLDSELVSWINRATTLHVFSRQQSFQAFYQKQAGSLSEFRRGRGACGRTGCDFAPAYASISTENLLAYSGLLWQVEIFLATDGYWFRRHYAHKNWLTTNFIETSVALNTGTTLQPKEVPDALWFEKNQAKHSGSLTTPCWKAIILSRRRR